MQLLSGNTVTVDNDCHNGAVISTIAGFATPELTKRPNVVLLHAGTNDMGKPTDPTTAPQRLANLIDQILSTCPDATVLVALIIPSLDPTIQSRINTYNPAVKVSVYFKTGTSHLCYLNALQGEQNINPAGEPSI